jgi:hypothetical protein
MKGFRQYITERLAIEDNPNAYIPPTERYTPTAADRAFDRRQARKYGAVMARAAASAMAAARRKSGRKGFPWMMSGGNTPGWWHPQRGWFTFSHTDELNLQGQFHVTQIVKDPKRFGISTAELNRALAAEAQYLNSLNQKFYDSEGTDYPYDEDFTRAAILNGSIDLAYEVQRLAYSKGWLKVYSGGRFGGSPTLEGMNNTSIRAALREISRAPATLNSADGMVQVIRVGGARNTEVYKWTRPREWQTA